MNRPIPSPLETADVSTAGKDGPDGAGAPRSVRPRIVYSAAPRLPHERLARLFDDGTFHEMDAHVRHQARGFGIEERRAPGDGVVVASGRVHGRPAFAFAQDRRFLGGSLGEAHARKIVKAMDLAAGVGAPIVGLLDSGGARIQEGVAALAGYGEIFRRNVRLSGRAPQISVVLGPCAGGAVYSPALTDFVILSAADALLFVTGPKVVKQAMFEEVDAETLGSPKVHAEKSGVAHLVRPDAGAAIDAARSMLEYLLAVPRPATPPAPGPSLAEIVPSDLRKPYDVRAVIRALVDADSFLEVQPDFAKNVVVGVARIDGRPVGLVANQPKEKAGVLDVASSRKAARFVRTMSAFGLPIVTLVDVPGFLPGTAQEHGGIITHGAKLLYAYCEARVLRLTVVLRKAFGGAYIVMASKHLGTEVNLAWPQAQIAVMGAEGAVEILHGKVLASLEENEKRGRAADLGAKYREEYMNVGKAAERGWIDAIVAPDATRAALEFHLGVLSRPPSSEPHGNVPL